MALTFCEGAPLRRTVSFGLLWVLAGCGGAAANKAATTHLEPTPPARQERADEGGMQVAGTLGTIPRRKIESALSRKMRSFQRCFFDGAQDVEVLAGDVLFAFVVDRHGSVSQVHLKSSDVGHRGVERCLLSAAASTDFPDPKGGDSAEFTWGFGLSGIDDVRPPVAMEGARVAAETPDVLDAVAACTPQPVRVTAYVARGGEPLSAGVSSAEALPDTALDCVAGAVTASALPEPGSYTGKISFSTP